ADVWDGRRPSWLGELVADTVHRQDVARIAGVGLDLAADVLDVRVNRALEGLDGVSAHRVEELRAREHASRMPRERRQQLKLRRRQLHGRTAPIPFHSLPVNGYVRSLA